MPTASNLGKITFNREHSVYWTMFAWHGNWIKTYGFKRPDRDRRWIHHSVGAIYTNIPRLGSEGWEQKEEGKFNFCPIASCWFLIIFIAQLSYKWDLMEIQGGAKLGLQLWACETHSVFLYYYLLIIVFSIQATVNLLLPHSVFRLHCRKLSRVEHLEPWLFSPSWVLMGIPANQEGCVHISLVIWKQSELGSCTNAWGYK